MGPAMCDEVANEEISMQRAQERMICLKRGKGLRMDNATRDCMATNAKTMYRNVRHQVRLVPGQERLGSVIRAGASWTPGKERLISPPALAVQAPMGRAL